MSPRQLILLQSEGTRFLVGVVDFDLIWLDFRNDIIGSESMDYCIKASGKNYPCCDMKYVTDLHNAQFQQEMSKNT